MKLHIARDFTEVMREKHPLETEGGKEAEDSHEKVSSQRACVSCCSISLHAQLAVKVTWLAIDINFDISHGIIDDTMCNIINHR